LLDVDVGEVGDPPQAASAPKNKNGTTTKVRFIRMLAASC